MTGKKQIIAPRSGWSKHIRDVDCPNEEAHTECLTGYLHWHEWAEQMAVSQHQVLCSGCNRWAIWVPNP